MAGRAPEAARPGGTPPPQPPAGPAPEPIIEPRPATVLEPAPAAAGTPLSAGGKPHLVVVTTRAVGDADEPPPGAVLATRFWHPRDQAWSVNYFETLEHALHLFVEESGWALLQQQALDGPHAHELVFRAREEDFHGPRNSAELLLEVGMSPEDVADILEEGGPDPRGPDATGPQP
jgi:hypothetical protein